MNTLKYTLLFAPLMALGLVATTGPLAYAANPDGTCNENNVSVVEGVDCAKGKQTQSELFKGPDSLFKTVTNVLLFLIGAISVIMLIIGGFRYVISNGDSTQVANAKNTILYPVIGIIVALVAYPIVNFVVTPFTD